jgi:hypothetical protein
MKVLGDESTPRGKSPSDHGLIYGNHPSVSRAGANRQVEGREGPRLVSIREVPDSPDNEAQKDGVVARAKVPSWDEIMFGISKKNDEEYE